MAVVLVGNPVDYPAVAANLNAGDHGLRYKTAAEPIARPVGCALQADGLNSRNVANPIARGDAAEV